MTAPRKRKQTAGAPALEEGQINAENTETADYAADVVASEAAQAEKRDGFVTYVTKHPQTGQFDILVAGENIQGTWDARRERVIFRVPQDLAHRFEMHTMFIEERIIKA